MSDGDVRDMGDRAALDRRTHGRGRSADRRRDRAYLAAVGAAVLLLAVAVGAILVRWRAECIAMERALDRELANAAVMLLDGLLAERRQADFTLSAPVYASLVTDETPPMRLADFSRATDELLGALELEGDPRAGTYRVDLRAPWPTLAAFERDGALRDSTFGAAVLARLAERRAAFQRSTRTRVGVDTVRVGGDLVHLLHVRQLDRTGSPVALLGVAYSVEHWYARMVPRLAAEMPLLPPDFYGVDWVTAARAGRTLDAPDPQAIVRKSSARSNAVLAIDVAGPDGRTIYRSEDASAAAFRGDAVARLVLEGFELRVAMPPDHVERLIAAAVPFGTDGTLLAGVTLLGALFVVGALRELRRQQQLADEQRHFVSAISHELRTPLAHMVLMSETLLGPAAGTPEQRRRWLVVIHREAVRLGRLVENVLLHARAERHDVRLDLQPVDVGALAHEVVESLDVTAAARGARIRAVVPHAADVRADPGAVRQVLLNLVDNALRYGPDGQTVTLTVLPPRAPNDPLVVTVDDEGPGIPPGDRQRVWAPFVRLGDRGGVTGGSGLGLSVVRDLVLQHGGRVDIAESQAGGARFVVTLPQRPPHDAGATDVAAAAGAGAAVAASAAAAASRN